MEGGEEGTPPPKGEREVKKDAVVEVRPKYEVVKHGKEKNRFNKHGIYLPDFSVPLEKEKPRFMASDLLEAVKLINSKDATNPYLRDAAGFTTQIIREYSVPGMEHERKERFENLARILIDHAVNIGNDKLANSLFGKFHPADRWLIYGSAYEKVALSPDLLSDWRIALETGQDTGEMNGDALVNASRLLILAEKELLDFKSSTDPIEKEQLFKQAKEYKY